MKERILQLIKYQGISKNKFYTETGLYNGFIDKLNTMKVKNLVKILDTYKEINPNWLIRGEGDMILKKETMDQIGEPQAEYKTKSDIVLEQKHTIEVLRKEIEGLKATLEAKEAHIQTLTKKD